MNPILPPEIVDNLILRVMGCLTSPHPELEAPTPRCPDLWTKEYDVFSITGEQELHEALLDAARIASEIATGDKSIHIEPTAAYLLRFPSRILNAMAEAGCTLELSYDAEDEDE